MSSGYPISKVKKVCVLICRLGNGTEQIIKAYKKGDKKTQKRARYHAQVQSSKLCLQVRMALRVPLDEEVEDNYERPSKEEIGPTETTGPWDYERGGPGRGRLERGIDPAGPEEDSTHITVIEKDAGTKEAVSETIAKLLTSPGFCQAVYRRDHLERGIVFPRISITGKRDSAFFSYGSDGDGGPEEDRQNEDTSD